MLGTWHPRQPCMLFYKALKQPNVDYCIAVWGTLRGNSSRQAAKVALGQDQQKAHIILNGNFLCLSCPSATFASQHGGFVPREWQAAKGLA